VGWYRVIKTIKGHRYIYEQRTWREGKKVRTKSRYVGPADGEAPRSSAERAQKRTGAAQRVNTTPSGERTASTKDVLSPTIVVESFAELLKPPTALGRASSWLRPWMLEGEGENLVQPVEAIEATIARLNPTLTNLEREAFFRSSDDIINMPPRQTFIDFSGETATQSYYATLLHELAHWTGNRNRLGRRSMFMGFIEAWYAREELVAEATAMILVRHFGIVPEDASRHAHYFQGYLNVAGDRTEALAYARKEAERAVRYILGLTLQDRPNGSGVV
jgi:hypothetical protein